ncbi:tetratricopeptide repeat protein, partial [Candidatus Woesearchaeota archaeon]|nr:tetratricopeptide repeat protein [Candidatus Woesearchaeota archaeon]
LLESKCTKISSASKDIEDKLHSGLNIDYLRGDHEIKLALDDYRQASDLSRDFLNIPDAPSLFDYICRFFMKEFDSNCKILNDLADYCIYLGLTDKATDIMKKIRPVDEDNRRISYNQLRDLIGNDPESFTSKILKGKSKILYGLQNLLEETKELVEDSRFKIELDYLDKVAIFAIHNTAQKFREQEDYEYFHKCLILEIKCNEIFIAAKGYRDFTKFVNFHAIANILNTARKQHFSSFPEAEKYYKEYEIYLEKAIELGVKAIDKIDRLDNNFPKFFSSLADAYRLRADLNVIKDERSSFKDYQKSVKLLEFMGDIIYEDDYLDWTVERLAKSYFSIKEYEKALEAYKRLFEKSKTKTYQAALGIGNVYDAMGNFPEARNYYLECLWISKEDPAAYDKLMNLHRSNGNYNEAIKWQQRMNVLKLSKKALDYGHFIIGILYEEKGEENKAIDVFRYIVTERQPDSLIALDHLITLLISIKEYREAIKWLQEKIKISTNILWDYCRLGDCYLALKYNSEALEYYNKPLSTNPKFIPSLQRLAKWYESNEQNGKAIEILNRIIDLIDNEHSHGLYKWLGDLYLKLKDEASALDAYNKSLEIKPRQYEIYDRTERITKKNKGILSLHQAINKLEIQYNDSPDDPELATQIINLCLSSDQKEYAKKIQKYLVFSIYKPDSIDYSERLALAYEMEEQYDLSIKERQKIDGFECYKPEIKFRNLRKLAELIKRKRLYSYRKIENQCTKEIEGFVKKNILTVDESETGITSENDVYMINIENNIYTFKEEISYLAYHYLDNGFFEKAHKFIQILLGSSRFELQNDKVYLHTKYKILKAEKKWEDAEVVVRKNIEANGETTRNLSSLGNVFRNKKEFSQAVECFRKAYAQDKHKHPSSADQAGATYRDWVKEEGLSEQMKHELKKKAIEWYLTIKEDHPEDTRIPYGLAKSYLLEPQNKEDIDTGVAILTNMLSKNTDRKAIKELLYLWSNNLNNTIEEIILNNYEIGVSGSSHTFLICEIVKVSKDANIFAPDVVRTFQNVFTENHDVNIRNSICKYFMKYMIYTCYQTANLKGIRDIIQGPLKTILDVEDQEKSLQYLTEFLGAEKGAYLEFLVEIIQPNIKKIEGLVKALDEDNYSDFASQIRLEIISTKERLKSIEFVSFDEGLVDIKKEIEHRHERYSLLAGRDMELLCKLDIKDNCCSKTAWNEIDSLIFDILDIAKDSYLIGLCTLTIKSSNQSGPLLVSAEFCDSQQEGWSEIISTIKEKFADRGINASFIKKQDSLIIQKSFKIGEGKISTPFKKLFDFIVTTYAAPNNANYWEKINRLAREEIILNGLNIQEKVENNLLLQISTLFSRAKSLIFIFLNEPHDLHHLCTSDLPLEERSRRIDRVKENIKEISFFTRGFFSKKTKEEFSIRETMLRIIQEYENISVFDNMRVKIIFEEKVNDAYSFVGISDDIEMVIKNLFYNAFGALKKRNNLSGKFNPVIRISIDKKGREYEILFSDNGIGISGDKNVSDLITDFTQKPVNDEKSKSGIGLYIISTLVNCYQGYFDIKSSRTGDNSGTIFIVRLPFKFSKS